MRHKLFFTANIKDSNAFKSNMFNLSLKYPHGEGTNALDLNIVRTPLVLLNSLSNLRNAINPNFPEAMSEIVVLIFFH